MVSHSTVFLSNSSAVLILLLVRCGCARLEGVACTVREEAPNRENEHAQNKVEEAGAAQRGVSAPGKKASMSTFDGDLGKYERGDTS